jgi:addiction module HigA family antidote
MIDDAENAFIGPDGKDYHRTEVAMNRPVRYRLKSPSQVGSFVKTEIVEPMELSVTDAAKALGITPAAMSTFLNERSSLSPGMALRIEKAFGVRMDTLMRMQNSYDIAKAA